MPTVKIAQPADSFTTDPDPLDGEEWPDVDLAAQMAEPSPIDAVLDAMGWPPVGAS